MLGSLQHGAGGQAGEAQMDATSLSMVLMLNASDAAARARLRLTQTDCSKLAAGSPAFNQM